MVAVLGSARRLDGMVVVDEVREVAVGLAAQPPVVPLEASPERPAALERRLVALLAGREMPLADAVRAVAVLRQHLGDEATLEGNPRSTSSWKPEANSAMVAMPFVVAFRPVSSEARVGEHSAVV